MTTQPLVTIHLNGSDPSLPELLQVRNELQEQLRAITATIQDKAVNEHPEFLKIDWDKLNRLVGR